MIYPIAPTFFEQDNLRKLTYEGSMNTLKSFGELLASIPRDVTTVEEVAEPWDKSDHADFAAYCNAVGHVLTSAYKDVDVHYRTLSHEIRTLQGNNNGFWFPSREQIATLESRIREREQNLKQVNSEQRSSDEPNDQTLESMRRSLKCIQTLIKIGQDPAILLEDIPRKLLDWTALEETDPETRRCLGEDLNLLASMEETWQLEAMGIWGTDQAGFIKYTRDGKKALTTSLTEVHHSKVDDFNGGEQDRLVVGLQNAKNSSSYFVPDPEHLRVLINTTPRGTAMSRSLKSLYHLATGTPQRDSVASTADIALRELWFNQSKAVKEENRDKLLKETMATLTSTVRDGNNAAWLRSL